MRARAAVQIVTALCFAARAGAQATTAPAVIAVPRDSIRGLERAVPGDSHIYLGTAIGMAAGAVIGYAYGSKHPGCKVEQPCIAPLVGVVAALPGALGGGVVGWLVGSRFKRVDWQPLDR